MKFARLAQVYFKLERGVCISILWISAKENFDSNT